MQENLISVYYIVVYIVPEKVEDLIFAVKKVCPLEYGYYKNVYFVSTPGTEFYSVTRLAEPKEEVDENKIYSNSTVRVEFSIPHVPTLLKEVLQSIWMCHPWKEPVIRVIESFDSRKIF